MNSDLRPYQRTAIAAVIEEIRTRNSTMFILPTGTGKTRVFAHLAEQFAPKGPVLFVAHLSDLVEQAEAQFKRWTPLSTGIEMGDQSCSAQQLLPKVVFASVQTLSRPDRLERFAPDAFSAVFIDEGHHGVADTFRAIMGRFLAPKVLATATAFRLDGQSLGSVCESVASVYTLGEAIRDGYLVPIRQKRVVDPTLDFSKLRVSDGDFVPGELQRFMMEEHPLHLVVAPTIEHAGRRPTLVFGTGVAHIHALAAIFNRRVPAGGKPIAVALDGSIDRKTRREALAAFRRGEFQFLIGCDLFLEGFDESSIACIAQARPTQSPGLQAQMVGRGTRLHPGKDDLLVLDFVGNSRHPLATTLDVVGGELDDRVREAAQRRADAGESVLDAIEAARAEVEAEDRRKREAAVMEARRKPIVAQSHSRLEDASSEVFDFFGFNLATAPRNGVPKSAKQSQALSNFGLKPSEVGKLDRAQASALLRKAIERAEANLCTRAQARVLLRHGIQPGPLSVRSAFTIIAAIKKNGWEAPRNAKGGKGVDPR